MLSFVLLSGSTCKMIKQLSLPLMLVDQPAADAAAVGPDALDEMQREVDDAFELI